MKIPYGIADFATIRRERLFYVDKTPFLAQLEDAGHNLVFLRPRRMGKSSLINMMAHYYDISRAHEFDELFGGLWVHQHPTPEKNAYVVLHLNFGKVSGTDEQAVQDAFAECIRRSLQGMLPRLVERSAALRGFFADLRQLSSSGKLIDEFIGIVQGMGERVYVMIDEYDTFANSLMATGSKNLYETLTDKTGFIRSFYRTLKAGVDTGGISRIFITGVAPLLLDDLYTGFNIATNITVNPRFNTLAGFTRTDVERAIDELLTSRPELAEDPRIGNRAALFEVLERFYNGYRFADEADERVFNSDMVLYCLRRLADGGKFPEQMLDMNVRTDYKKFYGLFQYASDAAKERREVLETVLTKGEIWGQLLETFGRSPPPPSREQFISLLHYTGMLTLSTDPRRGTLNRFEIPNHVIRNLQWEHFSAMLNEASGIELGVSKIVEAQYEMAVHGDVKTFLQTIHEQVMKILGLKDLMKFDEKAIKRILITSAVLSNIFYVLSEKEFAQGYCDLFMFPKFDVPGGKYAWLIELKYVHADATERAIHAAFAEAETQIQKYSSDKVLIPMLTKEHELRAAAIVFIGTEQIRARPWAQGFGEEIRVPEIKVTKKAKTATSTKKTVKSAKKAVQAKASRRTR